MSVRVSASPILSFVDVTKNFGLKVALSKVSLDVAIGESVAIVGDNGAGKSTLLKLAAGLLNSDAGSVRLREELCPGNTESCSTLGDVTVGASIQGYSFLYGALTVRENLEFYAKLKGVIRPMSEVSSLIQSFALEKWSETRISCCSQGVFHKTALSRAMLGSPALHLLDEPTSYLDGFGRSAVFSAFERFRMSASSVMFASHDAELIERFADKVVTISQGRITSIDNRECHSSTLESSVEGGREVR